MTQLRGGHGEHNNGPRCRRCQKTEARCAFDYGRCCDGCLHWLRFDKDGNDEAHGFTGRVRVACDRCRRIRRACSHRQVAA